MTTQVGLGPRVSSRAADNLEALFGSSNKGAVWACEALGLLIAATASELRPRCREELKRWAALPLIVSPYAPGGALMARAETRRDRELLASLPVAQLAMLELYVSWLALLTPAERRTEIAKDPADM